MKVVNYVIKDELGIHARPAAQLVKEVGAFSSSIKISNGAKEVDAKRLIAIMSLGVRKGDEVKFTIEGADEDKAAQALENFLKANL